MWTVDWCWEGQGEINMAVISGHICIDLSSGTARVHLGQGGYIARQVRGGSGDNLILWFNDNIISEFPDYCFGISPPEPRYSQYLLLC